eukprot:6271682-Alexandrium_andersonii.AAC.1
MTSKCLPEASEGREAEQRIEGLDEQEEEAAARGEAAKRGADEVAGGKAQAEDDERRTRES